MKAAPLLIHWHDEAAIYSADFEHHGKGRLATAGGDHHVRIWQIEQNGEERIVTYLATLSKHTGSVNVVRWSPTGDTIATAGDDGNILLWEPAEDSRLRTFGEDNDDDKEHWRVKRSFRVPLEHEVYDLAWSPNGQFFITGSMDNVARIWNASTGNKVCDVAQHGNYVQGVAWDPLNEFVATQSSDKSVHVYRLKHKEDGEIAGAAYHNKFMRYELNNPRRISSSSPAPPDFGNRPHSNSLGEALNNNAIGSPLPSAPGTPQSLALPMNPPPTSRSRRSSFGSSPAMRRSASPAPSVPLPAIMPSTSPSMTGLGLRTFEYAGEGKYSSFFRRLTFSPDGSLLFTPSGQYRVQNGTELVNTVYIYTRGGLSKPPVAYLPGHKKPSIAVKCSPVFYNIRGPAPNAPPKHITLDTSSADGEITPLPEPAVPTKSTSSMDPPPISAPSPATSMAAPSPKAPSESDGTPTSQVAPGPLPAFDLPYRIVYAVATQDALYLYDTQQKTPLCIVNNLHYAPFTDIAWAPDGLTVLVSSSDGFCSALTFAPNELGTQYTGPIPTIQNPLPAEMQIANLTQPTTQPHTASSSQQTTPAPTPIQARPPPLQKQPLNSGMPASPASQFAAPVAVRPGSPARSMSASSIATEMSIIRPPSTVAETVQDSGGNVLMHPTPSLGAVPSVAGLHSAPVPGNQPLWTPPETPLSMPGGVNDSFISTSRTAGATAGSGEPPRRTHSASSSVSGIMGSVSGTGFAVRRDSELSERPESQGMFVESSATGLKRDAVSDGTEDEARKKRRRIAPTSLAAINADSPAAESVTGSMDPPSVPPSAEP